MDSLGRYYTEQSISYLLVNALNVNQPRTIVDLGIGEGSLTKAAHKRWGSADFLAIDIDSERIKRTKKELPFVTIKEASGTDKDLAIKLNLKADSVDVAICNPPYLKIEKSKTYDKLFVEACLPNCRKLKCLTSDLIFLAQNLRLLKYGGVLGIILPDGLLTSHDFELLRQDLLSNHTIKSIIQLPDKIFRKTEARTHILIIEKGKSLNTRNVSVYLANSSGKCTSEISVKKKDLKVRMDYNYHSWKASNSYVELTLGDLGAEIKRGSCSYKELKESGDIFFHTTSFANKKAHSFRSNKYSENKVVAKANDIILARVGKRCIGKFTLVKRGSILLSDCVYRIRVKKEFVPIVTAAFASKKGEMWFKMNSHGVCALVISKTDLLRFPIVC